MLFHLSGHPLRVGCRPIRPTSCQDLLATPTRAASLRVRSQRCLDSLGGLGRPFILRVVAVGCDEPLTADLRRSDRWALLDGRPPRM